MGEIDEYEDEIKKDNCIYAMYGIVVFLGSLWKSSKRGVQ